MTDSDPPQSAQDAADLERIKKETVLDLTQLGLGVAGIFDPTPASDGINAGISLGRAGVAVSEGFYWTAAGYTLDSALNAISAVPYLGDLAAKPFEFVRTSTRLGHRIEELGVLAEKGSHEALEALKALKGKICGNPAFKVICEKIAAALGKAEAKGLQKAAGTAAGEHPALGAFAHVSESMSTRSARYQSKVTGTLPDVNYIVDGVKFDGYVNGVLLDAKAGYKQFVKNGEFVPWFEGADGLVKQAQRQVAVARGSVIQWHFAEQPASDATLKLFKERRISGIDVIFSPE